MSFMKADDWYQFKSNKLGFSIEFPGKPTEKKQVLNSDIGELNMRIIAFDDSKRDNLIYMFSHTVYPDTNMSSNNKEFLPIFYRFAIDGTVEQVGGKLLSEKKIYIGKYEGREFVINYNNGKSVIKARSYLVGNTLYQMQAMTAPKYSFNKSIERYLDSFKLIN